MNIKSVVRGFGSLAEAVELLNETKQAILDDEILSNTEKLLQIAGITRAFDLIATTNYEYQIQLEKDKEEHDRHVWDGIGQESPTIEDIYLKG